MCWERNNRSDKLGKFYRERYAMQSEQSGVMVTRLDPLSPAASALAEKDLVMAVDGVPIADDGTIEFRCASRTHDPTKPIPNTPNTSKRKSEYCK